MSLESHTQFVKGIFSRVASRYDLMNDVMSLGIHRLWKRHFVQRVVVKPTAHYVDVSAGTGDITRLIYQKLVNQGLDPHITAVDPNAEMLSKGEALSIDHGIVSGISWMEGSAEALPLEDQSVDVLTISFGLRNVSDRQKALQEFYRVLKPGGQFLCLEFSHVQHSYVNMAYNVYNSTVVPKLGKWIGKDEAAYRYLVESIAAFPDQETLTSMIESVGFRSVNYENIMDGIVAIHQGWKI